MATRERPAEAGLVALGGCLIGRPGGGQIANAGAAERLGFRTRHLSGRMSEPIRATYYARVSSQDQAEGGISIHTQPVDCRRAIEARGGSSSRATSSRGSPARRSTAPSSTGCWSTPSAACSIGSSWCLRAASLEAHGLL
jgi:hypothetical protein